MHTVCAPERPRPCWPAAGFSLVELLVVLGVASVLLVITVPSLSQMLVSTRVTSSTNALILSLTLARSEAIKRNARAVVCRSASGMACAVSGGWEQGWIVFHDANNNAALDAGESILQVNAALPGALRLSGNAQVQAYVSFSASGAAKLTSGAFQSGTFTLCPPSGSDVRQIVLGTTGRARSQPGAPANCP